VIWSRRAWPLPGSNSQGSAETARVKMDPRPDKGSGSYRQPSILPVGPYFGRRSNGPPGAWQRPPHTGQRCFTTFARWICRQGRNEGGPARSGSGAEPFGRVVITARIGFLRSAGSHPSPAKTRHFSRPWRKIAALLPAGECKVPAPRVLPQWRVRDLHRTSQKLAQSAPDWTFRGDLQPTAAAASNGRPLIRTIIILLILSKR
jgi:hypothetical protein